MCLFNLLTKPDNPYLAQPLRAMRLSEVSIMDFIQVTPDQYRSVFRQH